MTKPALTARDLQIVLSGQDRSFQLSVPEFALRCGEPRAIIGESGSGKTLFLEAFALLRAPRPGSKLILTRKDGTRYPLTPLLHLGAASDLQHMRARLFGFVPQVGGLLPALSARENVLLPQRIGGTWDPGFADHLMRALGLSGLAGLLPGALSIGQRQRVAIARALAHRPSFVIADEPTAALDPDLSLSVLGLLLELVQTEGIGLLLASHDHAALAQMGIPSVRLAPGPDSCGNAVEMVLPADAAHPGGGACIRGAA
ncbi:MAG: ATP-binding cassette domain-containing protein [Rhodobacteraceae bacterium]|nr:ATP-binding cassette domain-containing protein [Paracoccaceae bacterium]